MSQMKQHILYLHRNGPHSISIHSPRISSQTTLKTFGNVKLLFRSYVHQAEAVPAINISIHACFKHKAVDSPFYYVHHINKLH